MKDLLGKVLEIVKRLGFYVLQFAYSGLYFVTKLLKIQLQKWKKCGVMKKLAKAQSGLGAEVYALYRQGVQDWPSMPSVQQQLRNVEAAESDVFHVDGIIDATNEDYARRKDELREKYSVKRAQVGQPSDEEL
ncbi:MAG: hypothetical protein MUF52_08115 [Syntrophobacteraceae bacterium]|jgi:hypothetical protein|nr:hypothetical protein [Syntrophobacteraceae bacterium]